MLRAERVLQGPKQAIDADVPALNRVFSESFTDRYRRDGLVGVRVPQLNPRIWYYAIRDAGEGAMLWFDERDVRRTLKGSALRIWVTGDRSRGEHDVIASPDGFEAKFLDPNRKTLDLLTVEEVRVGDAEFHV